MLTIFTTCKPFRGHAAVIQNNAIKSWTLLGPQVDVILIGDDEGAAEVAANLGIHYVPQVARNEFGRPLLNSLFEHGRGAASNDVLCYVNADIMLMHDFLDAVHQVRGVEAGNFLIVGRRWDVDIAEPWDFSNSAWEQRLRKLARASGIQQTPAWIDYFVFPRSTYAELPPFVIGRPGYDNWLIWRARQANTPVFDATLRVTAVHQNHGYAHITDDVWNGKEAQLNMQLAGGWTHMYTIEDATHCLKLHGVRRNMSVTYLKRRVEMGRRSFLDWTRPIRHRLGLRRAATK